MLSIALIFILIEIQIQKIVCYWLINAKIFSLLYNQIIQSISQDSETAPNMKPFKSSASIIKEKLSFECPLCFEEYNTSDRYPMIICPNQHSYCLKCTEIYIFKGLNQGQCSFCKQVVNKSAMVKFRFLNDIKLTASEIRGQESHIRKAANSYEQCKMLLNEEIQKKLWLIKQYEQKESQNIDLKQKNELFSNEINRLTEKCQNMKNVEQKNYERYQKIQLQNNLLRKQNERLKQQEKQFSIGHSQQQVSSDEEESNIDQAKNNAQKMTNQKLQPDNYLNQKYVDKYFGEISTRPKPIWSNEPNKYYDPKEMNTRPKPIWSNEPNKYSNIK